MEGPRLVLMVIEDDGPTTNVQIGFSVSNLDAAHERAMQNGAELIHVPQLEPWGATSRYHDFDGNVVSLTESNQSETTRFCAETEAARRRRNASPR